MRNRVPVNILMRECSVESNRYVFVYPIIGTEADSVGDGKIEASIPVNYNQNKENDLGDAKNIWEVCACFRFIKKFCYT